MILDRVADRGSAVCSWTLARRTSETLSHGLPFLSRGIFVQSGTTVETSGGDPGQVELVAQFVEHALHIEVPKQIRYDT